MSRLLIPRSGQASESLAHGSGIVIAPGGGMHVMAYDFGANCFAEKLSNGTGTGAGDVNMLVFPASRNVLYQTNVPGKGGASAALGHKVKSAAGIALIEAQENYELSPYYQKSATIHATQRVNENVFITGTSPAFYLKTTFQIGNKAHAKEMFVGFSSVQNATQDMNARTDCYGVSIQDGSVFEYLTQNNSATSTTETDTSIDMVNSTDMTIEVFVSATGVATIKVDGVLLNSGDHGISGYTFDSGDLVYPLIHTGNTQGNSATVFSALEIGSQAARS